MQHTVKSSKQRFAMGSARYAKFGLVGVKNGARKDGSQLVKRKRWERFTMGSARYEMFDGG